jgi:hypothetical protein
MEEHRFRSQPWSERHGTALLPYLGLFHDPLQHKHYGSRGHIAVSRQNIA